jgi:molecular chaperone GrpE
VADRKHPEKAPPSPDSEAAAEARRDTLLESSEGPASAPLDAAALADQLAAAQAEKEELRQTLVRRQADFENYRKRIERERLEEAQRAVARLIEGLLPVLDAFERALAAHDDPTYEDYRKGFELIYRQLRDALERQGLNRIEAEGKTFDPHLHHAIERIESEDHEDGAVLEVLQPGYRLRDKVLRPATVRVAVHPGERASQASKRVN